jgi:hypothetical protein
VLVTHAYLPVFADFDFKEFNEPVFFLTAPQIVIGLLPHFGLPAIANNFVLFL